ncbi:MAG: hypothetical protein IJW78_01475 [Clostridia bacterium]|nr:hypothetical protein [Clostridia bacterium]
MIQIQPENNALTIQALCRTANIPYRDTMTGAIMHDGDVRLGYSLFEMQDGYAVIHAMEPVDDVSLADGMLRSTIHMALQGNCFAVYYTDSAPEAIFIKLGFVMNCEKKQLNTHKLFEGCSGCK